MVNKLVALTLLAILSLLLFVVTLKPAGDIVEYYGMTESILKHGSVKLTDADKQAITKVVVHEAYFNDPQYYVAGLDNNRYPVHFWFYSLLAIPARLLLQLTQSPLITTLAVTNLFILAGTCMYIINHYFKVDFKRLVFFILVFFSPVLSFIIWPGAEVYYFSLLLIAVFSFFKKNYLLAAITSSMASWQSQPLVFLALFFWAYYVYISYKEASRSEHKLIHIAAFLPLGMIALPYLYNFIIFGKFTPWTAIYNEWTLRYGVGLQNVSIKKLFEMFFDLNIGLFWYAPLIVTTGTYYFAKLARKYMKVRLLGLAFIITALLYQTNPAWHYGTAGFTITRYSLFLLPFFIYFVARGLTKKTKHLILIAAIVITQLGIHSFNNFVFPNFEKTLYHSPFAKFAIEHYPVLYNPTPEIFVDRTNHTDLSFLTSAFYIKDKKCLKAFVLKTDIQKLIDACGKISEDQLLRLDNELARKANYPRQLTVIEATLWPDTQSCENDKNSYICMHTLEEVVYFTGIQDTSRIIKPKELPFTGVWKIAKGPAVAISVPPGYILDYPSFEGRYVNF